MTLLRIVPRFLFMIIFNLIPAELVLIPTHFSKSSVLNSYRFSFFVNIMFLWNHLPYSISCIDSRKVFCSAVLDFYS